MPFLSRFRLARKSELNRIGLQAAEVDIAVESKTAAVPPQSALLPHQSLPPQPLSTPQPRTVPNASTPAAAPPPPLPIISTLPQLGGPFATVTPSVKPVSPVTLKVNVLFFANFELCNLILVPSFTRHCSKNLVFMFFISCQLF